MEKKFNVKVLKMKKSDEKTMYIFFNLTKGIGIKRMRTLTNESNIRIGDKIIIEGENYILLQIFNFKKGEIKTLDEEIGA